MREWKGLVELARRLEDHGVDSSELLQLNGGHAMKALCRGFKDAIDVMVVDRRCSPFALRE
jgi:hypothetical protein